MDMTRMTDSNAKTNTETAAYKGYIERIRGGVLLGWAADEKSKEPIPVKVLSGDKEIGFGVADIERLDLKKAGIHEGKHGFRIELSEEIKFNDSLEFSLIHAETLEPIKHTKFSYSKPKYVIDGYIDGYKDGHIVTRVNSSQSLGQLDITLFADDEELQTIKINSTESTADVYFPLPASKQDGKSRLYKLIAEGYPFALAFDLIQAKAIKTPWQHIKDSYKKPGFMSLPAQADHRYESLKLHLDAIANGSGYFSLENLTTLHDVVAEGHQQRTKFPSFTLPKFDKPRVSIIVPAYNKFELTYHCIASIALAFNETSYEVILADDCSSDETSEAEKIIENLEVSRNPENLRFLRSCNRATEVCSGEFIVFLNNDTEVTSYWLDELVEAMDRSSEIGMTGSKLLNEDGSLQEAGGIVWKNGQPWNVGRNANPIAPEYNYARQVDYLTGAAMCIRKELWEDVGRFSEELVPCYYEDTDLAFKVRAAGFKTVYVPHSTVIHFEGQSHGTDVTKGLKKYQAINEKTFRAKWFSEFRHGTEPSHDLMAIEKDRNIDQRILVIDYATPMPNKDAGSYAIDQEMKLMVKLGFKVTFVPENMAHWGKYTMEMQKNGIEVIYSPFYTSPIDFINKRIDEFDAVYLYRYAVAERYIDHVKAKKNIPVVFNNCDLHFLRLLRAALTNGQDSETLKKALETREKELRICQKSDAVLCYNKVEHSVIASHILEMDKLHLTPWVLEHKTQGPSFEEREGISFLGGYNHTPNVEVVEYLVNDIMPELLKKRPEITLYIYGSNMPESFEEYNSENVKVVGFAESLDDVYHHHRVFLAPLLSGAGIKGKVLESMAYGLPAVLTDVAIEGTGLTDKISTLVADDVNSTVDAVIKLYDDGKLWNQISQNVKSLVDSQFSEEVGLVRFKKIFEAVGLYSVPKK